MFSMNLNAVLRVTERDKEGNPVAVGITGPQSLGDINT
jgi:hypothetical protein